MKLRTQLMVGPAVTAGMLVLVLAVAFWAFESFKTRSDRSQSAMLDEHQKISTLQSQLGDLHIDLYRTMAVVNLLGDKELQALRQKRSTQLGGLALLAAGGDGTHADDTLARFAAQINTYRKASDMAIELSTEAPNADAMKKADEQFRGMDHTLGEAVAAAQAHAADATTELARDARRSALMVGLFGLAAAAASIAFAWHSQRRINANIGAAAVAAHQVAAGRLDRIPHSGDQDEIGALARSLESMVEQLRGSIASVREASESIHQASSEIAAGNLDLSQRTEQAASHLQQAASSMTTLTDSIGQNAEVARQANRLAASAAEVAAQGRAEVSAVVSTMQDIQASSSRIGDIIGVIDGIAFQTNILALNAAVEAARAGEQGRGFAVVAGEVRALAGRSAEAASEIKDLIGASLARVEAGSQLVAGTGKTMEGIVASVQQVAGLIDHIATSAGQQSEGIRHITASVSRLDQVTQQNSALVEQGAAATEQLQEQALRLTAAVGRFQWDEATPLGVESPPPQPLN